MRRGYLPYELIAVLICVVATLSVNGATAQSSKFEEFPNVFPNAGDMAPDFTLKTVDGETFTLSEAYGDKVLFIVLYQREAHAGELRFEDVEQPEEYDARLDPTNGEPCWISCSGAPNA